MNKLIKFLKKEQIKNTTYNGMITRTTSGSACADLFFIGGAARNMDSNAIKSIIARALSEDFDLTVKILGYIRDPRGGMGERNFFRHFLNYCVENDLIKNINISHIPEIGRWDDLFSLFGSSEDGKILSVIRESLMSGNGLCAKWMPRKGPIADKIRKSFGLSPKDYRKLLVRLTRVVESQMCRNEWKGIEYSHVPSVANVKYNKAFLRHDEERRRMFLNDASKGKVRINSSVAFPHDIIKLCIDEVGSIRLKEGSTFASVVKRNDTALAMWNQLPNYLKDNNRRILPICDTSGSMRGLPIMISLALGLYISERNKGPFQNAFMTFSQNPYLQYVEGNLFDRLSQIRAFHPSNTNLEATFKYLLNTAIDGKISKEEMPTDLLIISDMEFDRACSPNYNAIKMIKNHYKDAGYDIPNIIFWNVNGREDNVPVKFNKEGVGLVSGSSPAVLTAVLGGKITPIDIINRAVNLEKYEKLLIKSN